MHKTVLQNWQVVAKMKIIDRNYKIRHPNICVPGNHDVTYIFTKIL